MNLTVKDIKIGDKFKQIKPLGSYFFKNQVFTVENIKQTGIEVNEITILLSIKNKKNGSLFSMYGMVGLTLNELNSCFKEDFSFVWGDWKPLVSSKVNFMQPYYYKTNGRIVYVKTTKYNKVFKAKAACHIDDIDMFDVHVGIDLALKRLGEKIENYKKSYSQRFSVGDKVKVINGFLAQAINTNVTGTVVSIFADGCLLVKLDETSTSLNTKYNGSYTIVVNAIDVECISKSFTKKTNRKKFYIDYELGNVLQAPPNYTILHDIPINFKTDKRKITWDIIKYFDLNSDLINELDFLFQVMNYENTAPNEQIGDIITYQYKNVITFISKKQYSDCLNSNTLEQGLQRVKRHMEENNLHYLAIGPLWEEDTISRAEVESIITKVFADAIYPIKVKLYTENYIVDKNGEI